MTNNNIAEVEPEPSPENLDETLTKQNSRKTSSLWNFIDYNTENNPGVPVCKKCNYVFSNKSGNSSIERHLLSLHNITIPKVRNKQSVLNFQCSTPWPAKEKSERDQVVVDWVIFDQQSFNVVENKKFIKMMNTFDPRYKVPDRHQIKELTILEFDNRRSKIKYDLHKIPGRVSFTADMWTSTISSEAYLGLTIHYIDQHWILQRFLLDIVPFKTRHTGVNIASAISKVLNEFNLTNKALALTTDNESAMVVCGRELMEDFEQALNNLSFKHYRCSAHILNLAVKQGLEIINQDIQIVRKLMRRIKNSVLLCDDLRDLCAMEKLEYLRPEIDIETRWNSTYYMLYKFQRMETALKMLSIKHKSILDLMPNTTIWIKIKVKSFKYIPLN